MMVRLGPTTRVPSIRTREDAIFVVGSSRFIVISFKPLFSTLTVILGS